jgi:hypothetical protein
VLTNLTASNSWSGVVRGAVFRCCGIGMDSPLPSKPCPRNYGLCVSETYAEYKHRSNETVKDEMHGRRVVPEQLIWIVRKGDLILPDQPLRRTFGLSCKFTSSQITSNERVRLTFVGTDIDDPPATLKSLPLSTLLEPTLSILDSHIIEENVVLYLDLHLGKIPQKALKTERRSWKLPYYKVEMDAIVEVSDKVGVKLVCGGTTLISQDTTFE